MNYVSILYAFLHVIFSCFNSRDHIRKKKQIADDRQIKNIRFDSIRLHFTLYIEYPFEKKECNRCGVFFFFFFTVEPSATFLCCMHESNHLIMVFSLQVSPLLQSPFAIHITFIISLDFKTATIRYDLEFNSLKMAVPLCTLFCCLYICMRGEHIYIYIFNSTIKATVERNKYCCKYYEIVDQTVCLYDTLIRSHKYTHT